MTGRPDTKERLIDAARRLALRKGFDRTTVSDVIAEAAVQRGSLYHYFPGKNDLGLAVLERDRVEGIHMKTMTGYRERRVGLRCSAFNLQTSTFLLVLMLCGMTVRAGDIPGSAQDVRPLLIGSAVPDVTIKTADGTDFSLRAAAAKKPSILIFYRGGWCPYCNLHLGQVQTAEADLLGLGYQILAISPDRPTTLRENENTKKLTYTLLSDASMTAAKAFGIAFRVDDATLDKYKGYGIDLEAASGETHHLLPVPAVFIVGTDGVISFAYVNPDYKVRLAPEVLLAAAKSALGTGGKAK